MSDNPYRFLGIKPGATPAQIRAAYRKQARQNHPDSHQGKSPEEQNAFAAHFHRVQWAYDVLMDPAQRAYYDAHGHTRDQAPQIPQDIAAVLVDCWQGIVNRGVDLQHVDIIHRMRLGLTDRMESARSDAQRLAMLIDDLCEMDGRILRGGDPENLLTAALKVELAKLEGAREEAEARARQLKRCLTELQSWSYRTGGARGFVEPVAMIAGVGFTGATA